MLTAHAGAVPMPSLLQSYVTAHAMRSPDATALVAESGALSYGALDERSDRLARLLTELGCLRGERVALLASSSPASIAAMLGVLKADAIYVPLDPRGPAARLARIVESAEPRWILAAGGVIALLEALMARLPPIRRPSVGWLDTDRPPAGGVPPRFTPRDIDRCPAAAPPFRARSHDVAYVMYTSAPRGPRGVPITHASVRRMADWARDHFGIGPADRLSAYAPLHVDLSVFDLYAAFAAGAQLHLVPASAALLPQTMARFIRDSALTQWCSAPAALTPLARFDGVREHDFPALRRVLWGGEVFPEDALIYWMTRLPHVRFTNLYGTTETGVASASYTLPAPPSGRVRSVPLGAPRQGATVAVLDESLRPAAADTIGEICVGGEGLGPGYWRDPYGTLGAYIPDPGASEPGVRLFRTGDRGRMDAGGLLHFEGRSDARIKHRGHRVELGEIETALQALGLLRECVVVAPAAPGLGATICCAYVPRPGAAPSPGQLRRLLLELLPPPMVPERWVQFEKLPRHAGGGIDRRQLSSYFEVQPATAG